MRRIRLHRNAVINTSVYMCVTFLHRPTRCERRMRLLNKYESDKHAAISAVHLQITLITSTLPPPYPYPPTRHPPLHLSREYSLRADNEERDLIALSKRKSRVDCANCEIIEFSANSGNPKVIKNICAAREGSGIQSSCSRIARVRANRLCSPSGVKRRNGAICVRCFATRVAVYGSV
jgi:hypothetical protein